MKGLKGKRLRFHLYRTNPTVIRKLYYCPFYNHSHLCQFQCRQEMELMPLVCRVFPREPVEYPKVIEVTLELSCIAAAKLFLEHPQRFYFEDGEEIQSIWTMENEDDDFYQCLCDDLDNLLDYLWKPPIPLYIQWQVMYQYIFKEHHLIVRNRLYEAKEVQLNEFYDSYPKEAGYAFYPVRVIDRIILEHIDYGALFVREPKLYRLIKQYLKEFSKKDVQTSDAYYHAQIEDMLLHCSDYELKYRAYFSYNMQQLYHKAFESYFILRQFLFAVLYTQLLMLFDLMDYSLTGQSASMDRQAQILMLLEQGVRHNPTLTENILMVLREEFL